MALSTNDILTRCLQELRVPSSSLVSDQALRVLAIINEVYRDIMAKYTWYWLVKRQQFNTLPKHTSGNITMRDSSFAATLSLAANSLVGRKLVVSNASDSGAVYRIATHASSSTNLFLDLAYTGPTAASVSYNIYQDEYSLATDCGRVLFMRQFGYARKLQMISPEEMVQIKSIDLSEGKPTVAALMDFSTSGDPTTSRQVWLHPYPDGPYRIELWYKQSGNAELSGTARPLIPDEYSQILIYGTLARAYPIVHSDLERGAYFTQLFNDVLNLMVAQQREYEGQPAIQPEDTHRGFYTRRRRGAHQSLGDAFFGRLPYDP